MRGDEEKMRDREPRLCPSARTDDAKEQRKALVGAGPSQPQVPHSHAPSYVAHRHDGHNDIYYGLQDDPYLLNNFDIIYQRYSEEWSKLLHKTSDVSTPELYSISTDGQQFNFPQNIIRVYLTRKRQFEHMVRADGFEVGNVDVTVILESPKLRDHIAAMRTGIAAAIGIDVVRVSIKAKTNEGLDAIGRGEAVAAHAIAMLRQRSK